MDHTYVNRELSLFSYEILGLVGPNGAGAHDLLRMAQHGRILDWAGESQYYVEPKRLAKLGYLAARKEPGKTRPRTVYTLTDKGLEALGAWARTTVRFTPVKSELLRRLLIADLVGEAVTRESISRLSWYSEWMDHLECGVRYRTVTSMAPSEPSRERTRAPYASGLSSTSSGPGITSNPSSRGTSRSAGSYSGPRIPASSEREGSSSPSSTARRNGVPWK